MQTDRSRQRLSPFAYLLVAAIVSLALAGFAGGVRITGAVIAHETANGITPPVPSR